MRFKIESWTIKQLLYAFDNKKLNINPPYQRNDIWTLSTQSDLITTIKNGFPIPNFFLHEKDGGMYDIADGQQRTRAILQYRNKEISDKQKIKFNNEPLFLDYKICIQVIEQSVSQEEIMEFYVKVNRAGMKLNSAELRKAGNFDSRILEILENLTKSTEFKKVEIFNSKQQGRMIDREYIEELAALLLFGIQDKKELAIKKLYESELSLTDIEISEMETEFKRILKIVSDMQVKFDFANSRYSQRNDFYTLFQFLHENSKLSFDILQTCFEILFKIAPDINPSNDDCEPFQDYAFNCVSQSNSKKAREHRITFFKELLLNPNSTPNSVQKEIIDYYDLDIKNALKNNKGFYTIDPDLISPKSL